MRKLIVVLGACAPFVLFACKKPSPSDDYSGLDVSISIVPTVTRNAGKTQIYIDYLVRSDAGDPLSREEFTVTPLKNDMPLDPESIGDGSNTPLKSSLNYHLVLDGSYSMLTHEPPAFHPMLDAAGGSIEDIGAVWQANGGDFHYGVTWFDEWIFETQGAWSPEDLASIPEPEAGTATRLFSATEFATAKMLGEHSIGIASGPRDRHIMIVFSDGKDNYSHYDQVDPPAVLPECTYSANGTSCVTSYGAEYSITRTRAVTLSELESRIGEHPNLTVNVLGLGSNVNDDELARLAVAGGGEYIHNPESSEVHDLFRTALQQFIDQHTIWFEIPEPAGEYTLALEIETAPHLDAGKARCEITYTTVGDPSIRSYSCEP